VIQDVLVDGVCYDEPSRGASGYRFRRCFDMEQKWNGIIILAEGNRKKEREDEGWKTGSYGETRLWSELVYESFQGIFGDISGEIDGRCQWGAIVVVYELNDDIWDRLFQDLRVLWFRDAVIDLLSFWWW